MIELIEKFGSLGKSEQKKTEEEIIELRSKLPDALVDEIEKYLKETRERKQKEEEVLSEINNNIDSNFSSYSSEYSSDDILEESSDEMKVSSSENIELKSNIEEHESPNEINNGNDKSKNDSDIDLNNLDNIFDQKIEEINKIKGQLTLIEDSKEKEKIQKVLEEKENEFNKIKFDLLQLLNQYKEKFNKEYEELNLIFAGEEVLSRKYKNNPERLKQISNKINDVNLKKKKCFENQQKVEELIDTYSNYKLNDKIKKNSDDKKLLKIEKNEHKPKLTWKTVVSIAAGIGVGATVYFTLGPLGVAVLDTGAGIAKGFVAKKRHTSNIDYDKEKIKIKDISGMPGKLKSTFTNFKTYLKSKEGLRDISWFLNSAIITGTSLSIGNGIKNFIASKSVPTTIENPIKEVPNNITPTTQSTPINISKSSAYGNIKIQNGIGNYDVSSGYDRASWALNHTNKESLISEYVNKAKSVFNKFVVLNSDGSIAAQCTTPGISIEQFAKSQGVDVSKVAVLVSDKLGSAQAWTSAGELVKSIGAIK